MVIRKSDQGFPVRLFPYISKIEKYYQYNTATEICGSLVEGNEPECKLRHGHFINPMLAKARKGKEKPTNYIIDIKYDGNRYQIHKEGKSVIIFNRKGKIVTDQYPDVVDIVKEFEVNSIILDTEIYPVNPDGSPAPHKLLGKRVHKKDKAEAIRECPVKMVEFDVLSINGARERAVRLSEVFGQAPDRYIGFVPQCLGAWAILDGVQRSQARCVGQELSRMAGLDYMECA